MWIFTAPHSYLMRINITRGFIFNEEQRRVSYEIYFRNGSRLNRNWIYPMRAACDDFREVFPDAVILFNHFGRSVKRFLNLYRQTGSVNRKQCSSRSKVRTEENGEMVRQVVTDNPRTSITHLNQQVNLPYETCQRILKNDLVLHPYRLTNPHMKFSERMNLEDYSSVNGLLTVLTIMMLSLTTFFYEAWFHFSGYINCPNWRLWSANNPHFYIETPLHSQKVGVWTAVSRRIVGPIFFNGTLNAEVPFRNLKSGLKTH
ncbi:hypothetical protein NQ318_017861 [Aromia moschata]|uniref:Uncharacterized protein n=1 Tax=Aromia moschata TaxID=1265417 RepID=A0AAV8XQL4_9CUCU|nr:hypothetical protein NQ318_017861 [Aromia moschata]